MTPTLKRAHKTGAGRDLKLTLQGADLFWCWYFKARNKFCLWNHRYKSSSWYLNWSLPRLTWLTGILHLDDKNKAIGNYLLYWLVGIVLKSCVLILGRKFSSSGWSSFTLGFIERWWDLHSWRCSELIWVWSWAAGPTSMGSNRDQNIQSSLPRNSWSSA